MSASPTPTADWLQPHDRLPWLDHFRGLAVIAMIWVHTANALLASDLQATAWFAELTFWHGLIAPAFFAISGFARGLFFRPNNPPGRATIYRLLRILLIGYALHFPFWAILQGDWTPATWHTLWQVDVLHTLAATGLILVSLEHLSKFPSSRRWHTFTFIAPLLLFVWPTEAAAYWHTGWLPLDAWFNRQTGSLFPLFPWVSFGIAGYLSGRFCRGPSARNRIAQLAGLGALLALVIPHLHGIDGTSRFFLQRFGWVLLALGASVWFLTPSLQRLPRSAYWLSLAGRHSLRLYVIHLLLIFSLPLAGGTLNQHLGLTQSLPETLTWFTAITLLSLISAKTKRHP
jgi:uncharacterized membrane protein